MVFGSTFGCSEMLFVISFCLSELDFSEVFPKSAVVVTRCSSHTHLRHFAFSAKRLDEISEAFHRFLWRPLWLVFGLILGRFGVSFPLSSQVRRCIFQVPIYIHIAPPLLGF